MDSGLLDARRSSRRQRVLVRRKRFPTRKTGGGVATTTCVLIAEVSSSEHRDAVAKLLDLLQRKPLSARASSSRQQMKLLGPA
ncbi:hypothetical protein JG688_00003245 [Phytophthora aleatoria]|uniref:Uncharacterized protein n=1 Tax=Phytophthora aleatoria TaxID=2496075 RepID=A0A8J5ITN9_9STRA|nr:hypothetical protein JG688_00003245 [Phytophthora aleatoria]